MGRASVTPWPCPLEPERRTPAQLEVALLALVAASQWAAARALLGGTSRAERFFLRGVASVAQQPALGTPEALTLDPSPTGESQADRELVRRFRECLLVAPAYFGGAWRALVAWTPDLAVLALEGASAAQLAHLTGDDVAHMLTLASAPYRAFAITLLPRFPATFPAVAAASGRTPGQRPP